MRFAINTPVDILGVVVIDLDRNGLGLPARGADSFTPAGGLTVVQETLRRVAQSRQVSRWVLSVPLAQVAQLRSLVGEGWPIEGNPQPEPPWRDRVRQGRKWALAGWRGAVGRASLFDEQDHPVELTRLADAAGAKALCVVRGDAPLVDASLVDAAVVRMRETSFSLPVQFPLSPPGLAGWVYRTDFVRELAERSLWPGFALGYRAWEPQWDLTEQLALVRTAPALAGLPMRLLADHRAGLEVARTLYAQLGPEASAAAVVAALASREQSPAVPTLAELEIELTTRQLVSNRFHPPPSFWGRPEAEMVDGLFAKLMAQYAAMNDIGLVTFAGHGEPLAHPRWEEMIAQARQAGIFGLALVTEAVCLTPERMEKLLASPLDVVQVRLDATDEATYQAHYGPGQESQESYAQAVVRLTAFAQAAHQQHIQGRGPLVVVSLIRHPSTLAGMAHFFNTWTTQAAGAFFEPAFPENTPHEDEANGNRAKAASFPREERTLLDVEPPRRQACRQSRGRLFVTASGQYVTCAVDRGAVQKYGAVAEVPLAECWATGAAADYRVLHQQQRWGELPICGRCTQWHRPAP